MNNRIDDIVLVELGAADADLLAKVYEKLFVAAFPDPDERESLENMIAYLRLKGDGWYGVNNYHILVATRDGAPCGACVSDYFHEAGAGVVEFIVTDPSARGTGLGTRLLDGTMDLLRRDADRNGSTLDMVAAEINDPLITDAASDSMDPSVRCGIWDRWGFRRLDFPYVQPALSEDAEPVENLMLIVRTFPEAESIPSRRVTSLIHEYAKWAMRIDNPDGEPSCRTMAAWLDRVDRVPLRKLECDLRLSKSRELDFVEIRDEGAAELEQVLEVYTKSFDTGPTTLSPDVLGSGRPVPMDCPGSIFHLYGIRESPESPIQGIATLFTFPRAGFVGYLAFTGSLLGAGHLRGAAARLGSLIRADQPDAHGCFIECEPSGLNEKVFARLGFRRVAVDYRQPPIPGMEEYGFDRAPHMSLMYRSLNGSGDVPVLAADDLMDGLSWILRAVYGIGEPTATEWYRSVERQCQGYGDSMARFAAAAVRPS